MRLHRPMKVCTYNMGRDYILYKQPIACETLDMVHYLHFLGISLRPMHCIHQDYPEWVTESPAIYVPKSDERYIGLEECAHFLEEESGVKDVLEEAMAFKQRHPQYRINLH